jgi:uncharacterized protein (TIGR02996 family)
VARSSSGKARRRPVAAILAAAEEALARGDRANVVGLLAEAWRASPNPAIADALDRAAGLLPPPKPLRGRSAKTRGPEWAALVARADPAELPLAILELTGRSWREAAQRLPGLARWPEDPRLATALVAILESPPLPGMPSASLSRAMLAMAEAIPDARLAARIAKLGGEGVEARATPASALGPEATDALARVVRAIDLASATAKAANQTSEALLAAIHAAPDDDGARLVWADVLAQEGDPRAELIVLQHTPDASLTDAQRRRAEALAKRCADAFLGPLAGLVMKQGLRFERGFPAAARLDVRRVEHLAEVTGDPRWSTFRALQIYYPSRTPLWTSLLCHEAMRSLVRLEGTVSHIVVDMAATPRRPSLETILLAYPHLLSDDEIALLHEGFPRLRELCLVAADPTLEERIARSPLGPILAR